MTGIAWRKVGFVVAAWTVFSTLGTAVRAADTKVAFIPSKIECQDVTPHKCAAVHTTMKVIEAKFRISASFLDGGEDSTVDFVYMLSSPGMRLKVLDFLPNTTLESTTAEDQIEVVDSTESSDATSGEAKVGYGVLGLTAGKSFNNKRTESNKYKRVAPKNLVLASGTTNRGHGVFYKLRPSRDASLEGAKEFTFLAMVPKTWRGDWCSVVCCARANKRSVTSTSVAISGIEHAHVGLFLAGDTEASQLSDSLTQTQTANGSVLAKQLAKEATEMIDEMHAAKSMYSFKVPTSD